MKIIARKTTSGNLDLSWSSVMLYVSKFEPETEFRVEVVALDGKDPDPIRKYYFSTILKVFLEAYGYDPDEKEVVHERLKIVFFDIEPDRFGVCREVPKLFSDDSGQPMAVKVKFCDWVIRKSTEAGYLTPEAEKRK